MPLQVRKILLSISLLCFLSQLFHSRDIYASPIRVVAKSGDIAPGHPSNARFDYVRTALLDNHGNATIVASLDQPTGGRFRQGIWSESYTEDLTLVAVEGQAAPEAGENAKFWKFGNVHINNNGAIAYTALLSDTAQDSGLWYRDQAGLQLIMLEGSPAPGLPEGSLFSSFELFNHSPSFAMNSNGDMAFTVSVSGIGIGLWSGNMNNGLSLRAQVGQSMPGFPESDVLEMFSHQGIYGSPIYMDHNGTVFFTGFTESIPNTAASGPNGLWISKEDGLQLLLREGDVLPDGNNPIVTGIFSHGPGSDTGTLPFITRTTNTDSHSSLVLVNEEFTKTILSVNDEAPDGAGLLIKEFFGAAVVNNDQQIFFRGEYGNQTAIWSNFRSGKLELVAQESEPAPGLEEGTIFAESGTSLTTPFRNQQINNNGQIAFQANLEIGIAGVTTSNDHAIWASDLAGNLRLIAREGQEVDVDLDDKRTIQTISMGSFNDLGQLSFLVFFTDGTSAALVSNLVAIPEPSTFGLILVASLFLIPTHRLFQF